MVCRHLSVAILTGPVFSGKTSFLAGWTAGRGDVAGLLSPDGPNGRRFVDLATGEQVAMEAGANEEDVVAIGRFRFRPAAFDWANRRLLDAASDKRRPIIVIDEIGPLELDGKGLRPGLAAALARADGTLVLVIREWLVERAKTSLAIPHASVFTTESWPHTWHGENSAP